MKPSQVSSTLQKLIQGRFPIWIWGPPGIGKSAIVKQVAEKLNLEVEDLRASTLDAVDVRGIPAIKDGRTCWNPPEFLPTKGQGILFLDELALAEVSVQAAILQLTLDRRLGTYVLPEGWKIVAASNRVEDMAGIRKIIRPLLGRFIHLNMEADSEDWLWWAAQNEILSPIRYFVAFRPNLLCDNKPAPKDNFGWPRPRSWHMLSDALKCYGENFQEMVSSGECLEIIQGTIGEGAALEFIEFVRQSNKLPPPSEILQHAETFSVPTSPGLCWAMIGMIVDYVSHNTSDKLIGQVFKLADRLNQEFAVIMIRDLAAVCPSVLHHKQFVRWSHTIYPYLQKSGVTR